VLSEPDPGRPGRQVEGKVFRIQATRKANGRRLHLVRYADDFVITGSSQELLEREVKPLVEEFLQERGLELSPRRPASLP